MKKIIDGKRYNTETAKCLHEWDNGMRNDFGWCRTALYQTKSGALFLAGEGGALSIWSKSCGQNSWGGGEGIQPITTAEALLWLETHDGDAAIEKHFGNRVVDA